MQCDSQGSNGAAYAATNIDFLGTDLTGDGTVFADHDLLTVHVALDVAINLKLILRNDCDLLAKNGEIVSYY